MSTALKVSIHQLSIARPIEHYCGTSSLSCQAAVWEMRAADNSMYEVSLPFCPHSKGTEQVLLFSL